MYSYRAGGTGPADPATAGPIFSAYLITIQIEEVASVYKDDIDVSELSTQLEIFGTSFSEPKATIHEVIKCLQSLSASQRLLLEQVCRVGRLLLVMPATNATSERSFSVLRRLKSYL
ncbi:MAG: hypothetical protein OXU61_11785, partial [Gammaproteobacteria bacterium]|nr:hypothetical protein [Gammaproteobacteria bacterium]